MKDQERMQELVQTLNEAARAYYQESRELIPNHEYDALYDELAGLEKKTGIVLAQSPTSRVGYEVVSDLPKEAHPSPMLSQDKTKDVSVLQSFLGNEKGILSWKMDGITIVLTYENGELVKAVTRGNGLVGEVVTPNARQFVNLPARIPFRGHLVLRGEAVISYPDFERINETIADISSRYKNPRNLCSGSVRQLDSAVTASRHVRFIAFMLVSAEENGSEPDFGNSRETQFEWLSGQGFQVVERRIVTAQTLPEAVEAFSRDIESFTLPSDGLVLLMDDIAYGESLGATAKFPRNSMAFKWQDELAETSLLNVEWSPSRTGLLNPVAVFEPVELEGTTVSRASVHNVSIVRGLKLGIGDRITVYKSNMIIPQIAENLTKSGNLELPKYCPVCGGPTRILTNEDVQVLVCPNENCAIKRIRLFELFVSRNAMNIDGLSTATMEKFMDHGFIRDFSDLYHLDRYRSEIVQMEGFGEKSYENLIRSVEASRKTNVGALLYAIGIPGVGVATGKLLAGHFDYDLGRIRNATVEELTEAEGVGAIMAADITAYFADPDRNAELDALLKELILEAPKREGEQVLAGKTFVITGSLSHFQNRDALKAYIEERGGKVAGSVSNRTACLINNDSLSNSSKNRKARELGVPVLTEEEFLNRTENGF